MWSDAHLGLHGYRHRSFLLESPHLLHKHLSYTQALIAKVADRPTTAIRDVRPPYGIFTPALLEALVRWGYRPVIGSIIPVHWVQPLERTVAQVLRHVEPGSLLVLHESLGGPPVAEIVDALVPHLHAANFACVTIDQVWQTKTNGRANAL